MSGKTYPGDCLCGHGKAEHHLTGTGKLTYCYRLLCGCEKYRPRGAGNG